MINLFLLFPAFLMSLAYADPEFPMSIGPMSSVPAPISSPSAPAKSMAGPKVTAPPPAQSPSPSGGGGSAMAGVRGALFKAEMMGFAHLDWIHAKEQEQRSYEQWLNSIANAIQQEMNNEILVGEPVVLGEFGTTKQVMERIDRNVVNVPKVGNIRKYQEDIYKTYASVETRHLNRALDAQQMDDDNRFNPDRGITVDKVDAVLARAERLQGGFSRINKSANISRSRTALDYRLRQINGSTPLGASFGWFARDLADLAAQARAEGLEEDAQILNDLAWMMADIALGLNPVTAFAQCLFEAGFGKTIGGEPLPDWGRALAVAGVLTLGSSKQMQTISRVLGRFKIPRIVGAAEGILGAAQRIGIRTKEGLQKFLGSAKTVGEVNWESWGRLPKVTRSGNEYAKIGDRLYPRHAVERMMPIKYGTAGGVKGVDGRGVPPMVVEHTIRHGVRIPDQVVEGVTREVWKLGDIEVITEDAGKIIVTIMRKSQ